MAVTWQAHQTGPTPMDWHQDNGGLRSGNKQDNAIGAAAVPR
jgi:hypothetical protein